MDILTKCGPNTDECHATIISFPRSCPPATPRQAQARPPPPLPPFLPLSLLSPSPIPFLLLCSLQMLIKARHVSGFSTTNSQRSLSLTSVATLGGTSSA